MGTPNPLQRAVQTWIDAEPGRSRRSLAERSGLRPSVLDAMMRRPFRAPPREATLQGLAKGLRLPLDHVRALASQSAGLTPVAVSEVLEGRMIQAALDELPAPIRAAVADLVMHVMQVVHRATDK